MTPNNNQNTTLESIRPSKRRKTSAAALPSATNQRTYSVSQGAGHQRCIQVINEEGKRAQTRQGRTAYWNTVMHVGAEGVNSEPVAGVRRGQGVPKIDDIDLTDPAAATEPAEPRVAEVEVEERPEEKVQEREEEVEAEVEADGVDDRDGGEEGEEEEEEADEQAEADEADTQRSSSSTASAPESAKGQIDIAPMEEFFDVTFNRNRMAYIVRSLKPNTPSWWQLDTVASCSVGDERIQQDDYVVIRTQEGPLPSEEENYAKVCEIRTLPNPDRRSLIRVAWLYRMGRRLHESNHYQIVLWDTVDGLLDRSQRRQIQRGSLFDACQTRQLCELSTQMKWRYLERQTFSHGPG